MSERFKDPFHSKRYNSIKRLQIHLDEDESYFEFLFKAIPSETLSYLVSFNNSDR